MDHERWLEQHDRMMADFDQKMVASQAKHDREISQIRGMLRHAVQLAVREARNERSKRRELDEKITQLAAAQLLTEEALRQLLERDKQRFGGNGNTPATD